MPSVYIAKRRTQSGNRWHVRCDVGRYHKVIHLGSFRSDKEARARANWARLELAAGRIPDRRAIIAGVQTVSEACDDWTRTLLDVAPATRRMYRQRAGRIGDDFRGRPVGSLRIHDVQRWVERLDAEEMAAGTIGQYLAVLRLVLDHAGVAANPARDRRVRAPRGGGASRFRLRNRAELAAVRAELDPKYHPAFALMERGGLRIAEAHAASWENVDGFRLLVADGKTSAARRWVDDLGVAYDGDGAFLFELGARRDGLIARGGQKGFEQALGVAIRSTGVPHFSAHDLRHLHASRMMRAGMSLADLAGRLGHANPAVTLRTYTHTLPPD